MAKDKIKESKKASKVKEEKKKVKSSDKTKKADKASKKKVEKVKAKRKVSTIVPINEKFTRTALLEAISTTAGIELKDTRKVFNAIETIMLGSLIKKGRGEFIWPTLFKVVTKEKPATKERKGISPFTGEECIFKAKPKTIQVKIRPLGKVKKAAKGEL